MLNFSFRFLKDCVANGITFNVFSSVYINRYNVSSIKIDSLKTRVDTFQCLFDEWKQNGSWVFPVWVKEFPVGVPVER